MDLLVRARHADDLPVLVELLSAQQAGSSYPIRWPLPIPTVDFLVRPTERRAWVAESAGAVVGHVTVAHVDEPLVPLFAPALGSAPMGMISVLFTAEAWRGLGVGGTLLDTAVAWIRVQGEVPVLDVVPTHDTALTIYQRRGWVEVGRARFVWLPGNLPEVLLMALPPYQPNAASVDS
ncbi:MAG: GNAT family N-acetyltransferase [Nocardioides sp.]|nr:GNAT family N-acetyltransferase [Nocardioides sp.]